MRTFGLIGILLLSAACGDREREMKSSNPPSTENSQVGNFVVIETPPPAETSTGAQPACQNQEDKPIPANRLRALGTEPFWAAEVEGRCVTYKTPEDQQGTRVWTHFREGPEGQVWKGALNGQEFQLVVKPAGPQGCSDGMSDKTYPLDVVLRVEGETRNGCAEPR
jgi:uncharacterized membrane protein